MLVLLKVHFLDPKTPYSIVDNNDRYFLGNFILFVIKIMLVGILQAGAKIFSFE